MPRPPCSAHFTTNLSPGDSPPVPLLHGPRSCHRRTRGQLTHRPPPSFLRSFSHKHNVAHHETQVLQKVNSAIWAPESGQIPFAYQYGACFEGLDLDRAGEKLGVAMNPMQGQIIAQIMQQYYPTPQAQNMLISEEAETLN